MSDQPAIQFTDGAGYERYMGTWSRLVGETFLDWLSSPPNLRWLDVGCGNGAFTERIIARCEPLAVDGIDPSEAQLAFARTRPESRMATFHQGDAMALPYADHTFDVAVMPLVIFFVPEPPRGVAEMARVVCPGGMVTAYAWDMTNGGFPYESLLVEMRALDLVIPAAPNPDASRTDAMIDLWTSAGLVDIETREISVQRTFASCDDYWATIHMSPSVGRVLSSMPPDQHAALKARMHAVLPIGSAGEITYSARANAVKGRRPSR